MTRERRREQVNLTMPGTPRTTAFLPREAGPSLREILSRNQRPNAANHPPARPRFMRAALQRVGCIGLLGRDSSLKGRGARRPHYPAFTPRPGDFITPRPPRATVLSPA